MLYMGHGIGFRRLVVNGQTIAQRTETHHRRLTQSFDVHRVVVVDVIQVRPRRLGELERVLEPMEPYGGVCGGRPRTAAGVGGGGRCSADVHSGVATSTASNSQNSAPIHADSTSCSTSDPLLTTPPCHLHSTRPYAD